MGVIVMLCLEVIDDADLLLRKLYLIQSSVLWREGKDAVVVDCYDSPRFELQKDMSDHAACGEAILYK